MSEEIIESAKAAQEVARASLEAIRATQKLGTYAAKLIKEPADSIIGILADRLKFVRWERQLRLVDKIETIIKERSLEGSLIPIAPKLALPIIENATLEEDDFLQDIWARLLVEAGNPESRKKVRTAFIDVIRQFEAIDAHVLHVIYKIANNSAASENQRRECDPDPYWKKYNRPPAHLCDRPVEKRLIITDSAISEEEYYIVIDNLMRLRCVKSYVEEDDVDIPDMQGDLWPHEITKDHQYNSMCVTRFGMNFVQVCLG